jgi:DNA-binding XRE family transcriptional regulator
MHSQALSTKIVEMTPAQCRAARALLDITQSNLAQAADLGLSTFVDFEKERRRVSPDAVAALQNALEHAGITFTSEGGGEGVFLRKPRHSRRK